MVFLIFWYHIELNVAVICCCLENITVALFWVSCYICDGVGGVLRL